MEIVSQFVALAKDKKAQDLLGFPIEDLGIQVYGNLPLQLNISISGQHSAILKVEERNPGLFTFAMAPSAGESIDYIHARVFRGTTPLETLRGAFSNENINHIVDVLQRH